MNEIVMIDISKIHPHKDNPRKDLGDLSELTDSIRKNGIMQNLTVVPSEEVDGEYTVVIGHRRLAAATAAGIKELPCVISDLTSNEQLAMMLTENMLRSDLTYYKQAQHMQMMLDLGETVSSVAEKTGFSKSTVKRRIKLTKLDADIFRETSEKARNEGRQIALGDYEKLFEITGKNERNKVLESIGTSDFEKNLNTAILNQEAERDRKKCEAEIIKCAEEVESDEGLKYLGWCNDIESFNKLKDNVPDDTELKYRRINCYYKVFRTLTDEEQEAQAKWSAEDKERQRKAKLKDDVRVYTEALSADMYKRRLKFIQKAVKDKELIDLHTDDVITYANFILSPTDLWRINGYTSFDLETYLEVLGEAKCKYSNDEAMELMSDFTLTQKLFVLAYVVSADSEYSNCSNYDCEYRKNPRLENLYELLTSLGYMMTDEEIAIINGTHEIYKEVAE